MSPKDIYSWFMLAPALLIGAFYFLVIQYATETIVSMGFDFLKNNPTVLSVISILIFAAISLSIVFVFFYAARSIEEKFVKKTKNKVVEIIFYYLLPIAIYLKLKGESVGTVSAIVVAFAIIIRQAMSWLFLRMSKKTK